MGVQATNYIVFGAVEVDRDKVRAYFDTHEKHYKALEVYDDNGYRDDVTPNKSGIHIIDDGMDSQYVVIGKILFKSLTDIGFNRLKDISQNLGTVLHVRSELRKIDELLGTSFASMQLEVVVFTHYH